MSKKVTTPKIENVEVTPNSLDSVNTDESFTIVSNIVKSELENVTTETPEDTTIPSKRRVTLNRVKSKFAQNDLKVTLVWDRTHFHFEFDGWEKVSLDVNKVSVPRIGDLTEDQWVEEVKRVLNHVSE